MNNYERFLTFAGGAVVAISGIVFAAYQGLAVTELKDNPEALKNTIDSSKNNFLNTHGDE